MATALATIFDTKCWQSTLTYPFPLITTGRATLAGGRAGRHFIRRATGVLRWRFHVIRRATGMVRRARVAGMVRLAGDAGRGIRIVRLAGVLFRRAWITLWRTGVVGSAGHTFGRARVLRLGREFIRRAGLFGGTVHVIWWARVVGTADEVQLLPDLAPAILSPHSQQVGRGGELLLI